MALRDVLAFFSFRVDDTQLKRANTSVTQAIGKLQTLGKALLALEAVRVGKELVNGLILVGDELDKTSRQLGISTTALEQWRHAAALSGVNAQELTVGIRTLQRAAFEAERGTKSYADAFDKAGVSVKNTNGELKTGDQLLFDVGNALQGMASESEKVALAQQLMGRSGSKLNVIFDQGADAVQAMLDELKLYGEFGPEAVQAAADAADAQQRWTQSMQRFKGVLAVSILPGLTAFTEFIARGAGQLGQMLQGTNLVRVGLLGALSSALNFARGFLTGHGAALRIAGAFLAKIILLGLVFDDLATFITGGDSALGRFIATILGEDATKSMQESLRFLIDEFKNLIAGTEDFETRFEQFSFRVGGAVEDIINDFGEFFMVVSEDMANFGRELFNAGKMWLDNLVNGFLSSIGLASGRLNSGVSELVNGVTSGLPGGGGTNADGSTNRNTFQGRPGNVRGPRVGQASLSQRNNININVTGGGGDSVRVAQNIGRQVGNATGAGLDDAAAALIALA